MKIRYDAISDVGHRRSNNEDMALVLGMPVRDNEIRSMIPMAPGTRFTAIVADGMGGYGGGEIASEIAVTTFNDFLNTLPEGMTDNEMVNAIKEWFAGAQNIIISRQSEPGLAQMGTTVTGIFTYNDRFYMINAGDSRVYRLRYDTLRQLSKDHSERERLGDPSVPSNLIYNAMGVPSGFVDVTTLSDEAPVVDGDIYVICSDGLSDMITDSQIESILTQGGGARQLVEAALNAGGEDNCTVIVLRINMPAEEPDNKEANEVVTEQPTTEVQPEIVLEDIPEVVATTDYNTKEGFRGFNIDEESDASADSAQQEPIVAPPVFVQSQYDKTVVETQQPTNTRIINTTTTVETVQEAETVEEGSEEKHTDNRITGLKLIKEGIFTLLRKPKK